jgi:tetratricopeptide (TPR) repeat protein
MDTTEAGSGEPPFVGASRRVLVDGLVELFVRVRTERSPLWVSLEAPTGWGKTRVVHEFYKRLAAEQQSQPPYWPDSILDAVPTEERALLGAPEGRRKRVYPETVVRTAGSLPDWFWWGIACAYRAGVPSQALASDLAQFAIHADFLEQAWRRKVGALRTARKRLRGHGTEFRDSATGDVMSAALSAAGAAVPGLGLLYTLAKHGISTGRERARIRSRVSEGGLVDIASQRGDLVDEFVPALIDLTEPGLPAVIFIEDLHLADPTLVEFLCRLLAAETASILVVTSTWPGELDEPSSPGLAMQHRVNPERLLRISEHELSQTATRLLPAVRFAELELTDLEELTRFLLPEADDTSVRLIVDRFPNPLALEVLTGLRKVRRKARSDGKISLSSSDLDDLPERIEELYEAAWQELPEPVQLALSLAVLATPSAVSEEWGLGDDRWDREAVRVTLEGIKMLSDELGDLRESLDDLPAAYSWARVVDAWLRRFHDPAQRVVALQHSRTNYDVDSDIAPFFRRLAGVLLGVSSEGTTGRQGHLARLLVALSGTGYAEPSERAVSAALWICEADAIRAGTAYDLARVARLGLRDAERLRIPLNDARIRRLKQLLAHALVELSKGAEAVALLEPLVEEVGAAEGSSSDSVLVLKRELARSLRATGGFDAAALLLEEVVASRAACGGALTPAGFLARADLAFTYGRLGRMQEAEGMLQRLVQDYEDTLGPSHPDALRARHDLAAVLRRAGRLADSLNLFDEVLEAQVQVLGPDHPDTLSTRQTRAAVLRGLGRYDEAEIAFRSLIKDRTRVLGIHHPDTFSARSNLAWVLRRQGRLDESTGMFRELVRVASESFDANSDDTLEVKHNLAVVLREQGETSESKQLIDEVVKLRRTFYGPRHPSTLTAESEQLLCALAIGDLSSAEGTAARLIVEREYLTGPVSPDSLTACYNAALVASALGKSRDAADRLEALADTQDRVLGTSHPETVRTRIQLAIELNRCGDKTRAAALADSLARECEAHFGPKHPDTRRARALNTMF